MRRGEIWWAAMDKPVGSEPGGARPVLIVQSDEFNRSGIRTVVVVGVTSNTDRARDPGNVPITRSESGLPRSSVINVSQVATLDRRVLVERIRTLSDSVLAKVDAGLKLVLSLS